MLTLAAASVPCSLVVVVATHFFEAWQENGIFKAALRGALAAAVAVMLNTAWVLSRPYVRAPFGRALVIVPTSLVLVAVVGLSSFKVLLLAAVAGLLWPSRGAEQ